MFFTLLALFGTAAADTDPNATSLVGDPQGALVLYWFGTDELGRDNLSRMIWGARASLLAGVVSVAIAVAIGVPFGLVSGYFGGWIDMVISRFTDALLAMPFLIFAIALAAFLGPSLTNAMIAIGLSAMPIFIRLTRGQVLAVKTEDYVEGARAVGLRHLQHHHALHPAQRAAADPGAGDADGGNRNHRRGQPVFPRPRPAAAGPELGLDAQHRQELPRPGAVDGDLAGRGDLLVVIGFNLLGDGLRDALDPRET